jgi:hypothetical protein
LSVINEIRSQIIHRIGLNAPRIKICLDLITEEDLWKRPNETSNSIGNLILHLCGNMTQYVISSLGNEPDIRDRDKEFSTAGGMSREECFSKLHHTVSKVINVIHNAAEEDLTKVRSVQGFDCSGIGIIVHVTEHFSYHTGQIATLAKLFSNKDLGFYRGYDLNKKNGYK